MVRTPDTLVLMPNQPRNRHRMVRFSDQDWADLGDMATASGSDRSAVLRQLAQWWMRRKGITLPERPEPIRQSKPAADGSVHAWVALPTPANVKAAAKPFRPYSKEQQARGKK